MHLASLQVGCVPRLINLMQLHNVALASAATTALMMITVANNGKYAVIAAAGGLQTLVKLCDPSNEQLCVNAMECISNVAEAPEARPTLQECGAEQRLARIHEARISDNLTRSAAQAIRQCRFRCVGWVGAKAILQCRFRCVWGVGAWAIKEHRVRGNAGHTAVQGQVGGGGEGGGGGGKEG